MDSLKQRAWNLHQQGAIPQALALYQKAEDAHPDDPDIPFLRAAALRHQNRDADAENALKKSLKLKPDFAEAHANLGILYQSWGHLGAAEMHFQDAHTYAPKNLNHVVNLAGIMQLQGRPADACAFLYPHLKVEPQHAVGWDTLGAALLDMGNTSEASGCFARAHQQNPKNAHFLVHLYTATAKPGTAKDLINDSHFLKEALKRDPQHNMARFLLAVALMHEHPIEAKQHLIKIIVPQLTAWKSSLTYMIDNATGELMHYSDTASVLRFALKIANVTGQIIEFGVRYGTTAQILQQASGNQIIGFDSFKGLPTAWHEQPAGAYSTEGYVPQIPNVRLIPGWFEETVAPFLAQNPSKIRLAHIDCDLYSSTKTVLTALAPYLQNGSILVFDEYLMNPKWQEDEFKAFQEWIKETEWSYEYKAVSYVTNQVVVQLG